VHIPPRTRRCGEQAQVRVTRAAYARSRCAWACCVLRSHCAMGAAPTAGLALLAVAGGAVHSAAPTQLRKPPRPAVWAPLLTAVSGVRVPTPAACLAQKFQQQPQRRGGQHGAPVHGHVCVFLGTWVLVVHKVCVRDVCCVCCGWLCVLCVCFAWRVCHACVHACVGMNLHVHAWCMGGWAGRIEWRGLAHAHASEHA